ncbi:MAG: dihydrofolate reductase [Methylobacteriaceae bacterium]|nr:dihydrofolate reductase [Methylobacteriaceae bacterium]
MTAAARLPLVLVAAVATNGVIGARNGLPWHLRSDLRHFRALTLGKPLIMGRRTFLSIGKPLPGRETIILTHDRRFEAPGVVVATTLPAAIARAESIGRRLGAAEIIVAGGGEIYAQTIGCAAALHITEVGLAPQGDTFFPPVDGTIWREAARAPQPRTEKDDADFTFVHYVRRKDGFQP